MEQQSKTIEDLQDKLSSSDENLSQLRNKCKSLEEQYNATKGEIASLLPLKEQVEEYKTQHHHLQVIVYLLSLET